MGGEGTSGAGEEDDLPTDMCSELKGAMRSQRFARMLPIQTRTWEALAGGRRKVFDLRICSPTGSGKTLAYALPVVQALSHPVKQIEGGPRCIVILPTRDLAWQVAGVFRSLATPCAVGVGLAAGMMGVEDERTILDADVLVATPGRLRAHLDAGDPHLDLRCLEFLVLDEADRLLQQSYHECIPRLLAQCDALAADARREEESRMGPNFLAPPYPGCQSKRRMVKIAVSATIGSDSTKGGRLGERFVRTVSGFAAEAEAARSSAAGATSTTPGGGKYELPPALEECKVVCRRERKPEALIHVLGHFPKQPTLVFTNSTEAGQLVHQLVRKRCKDGTLDRSVASYNSRRDPAERAGTLQRFRDGDVDVLVASDALSRGIDVCSVSLVVHYDSPTSAKNYVHRVGRTARVGGTGTSVVLLQREDVVHFKRKVLAKIGRTINGMKVIRLDKGEKTRRMA